VPWRLGSFEWTRLGDVLRALNFLKTCVAQRRPKAGRKYKREALFVDEIQQTNEDSQVFCDRLFRRLCCVFFFEKNATDGIGPRH
jgi:hypothetical protein